MNDPSNGVPPNLLPHVHLVSSIRFAQTAQLEVDTAVDYLLQAPTIVRGTAPMNWQLLSGTADGTTILVWQPPQLGNAFASDGYIWGDPETVYSMDLKGVTVEVYIHRTGYLPPNETIATHSRRRYRLVGSREGIPVDTSLWIVHYGPCDANSRVPANRIPIQPQIQQIMNTRRYLLAQGQLVRKEFMLHDRNNWPTINPPQGQMPGTYPPPGAMYASPTPQVGRNPQQSPYYSQQPQSQAPVSQPGAKRARATGPSHGAGAAAAHVSSQELSLEEEENTSTGDMLDNLTPREISVIRFKDHDEWMGQVLSSAYSTDQIIPVDLGLGLKGELEPLTKGIFEAPAGPVHAMTQIRAEPRRVGKLEAGKAEEFKKRAEDRIAEMNVEMERMKRQHERRMEKMKKWAVVKDGEHRLRIAGSDDGSTGTESWRLEGLEQRTEDGEVIHDGFAALKLKESIREVVRSVETTLGVTVRRLEEITLKQTGGLLEKPKPIIPEPERQPVNGAANAGTQKAEDMDNANEYPVAVPSAAADQADRFSPAAQSNLHVPAAGAEVEMDMGGDGSGDWVMVSKDGESSATAASARPTVTAVTGDTMEAVAQPTAIAVPDLNGVAATSAPSAANVDVLDTTQFDDFEALNNADSMLAEFENSVDLGALEVGADLDMENSAFGDAFHATESRDEDNPA